MSEEPGGLFAGLSMSPMSPQSSPVGKKSLTAAQAETPVEPSLPPAPVSPTAAAAAAVSTTTNTEGSSVESAPVTDKLLGLFGGEPPSSPTPSSPLARKTTAPPLSPQQQQQQQKGPDSPARKELFPTVSKAKAEEKKSSEEDGKEKPKIVDEGLAAAFSLDSKDTTPMVRTMKVPKRETKKATLRGVGVVHEDTPIPNSAVALRLLRKFAAKTRPMVSSSHGGTQRRSIYSFVFGMPSEYDRRFDAYRELIDCILDGDEDGGEHVEETGDVPTKARKAIARFCHLISTWGHASTHMAEAEQNSQYQAFCSILAVGLDTATSLVTHGCLDGVVIGIGDNNDDYHRAVDILAESVFASDLSQDRNELAAMKFLLSTGCRVGLNGEAMLRGTHLLQTIRVLYHVYLSTISDANKTTARASLQQLVTSVFIRMIASSHALSTTTNSATSTMKSEGKSDEEVFPTPDHRDAFLVLRSLCKLSMRTPPSGKLHSHVGLQASGSNPMWDSAKDNSTNTSSSGPKSPRSKDHKNSLADQKETLQLVSTQAIHPALESKILAMEMMLYVLQNTDMKGSFLQKCGPQFHYAIRNYLCLSLLKNCTSDDPRVVNLSLRVFVPIIHNFRALLKSEIEAFVTNVFFVILDSQNSPIEHKSLVVTLFDEICSDPTTLAEIFLNYDCDLSAVDLFHRIVNTLSKVARTTEIEDDTSSSLSLVTGAGAARMEKIRRAHRELRLDAMRALRQVLASLHASITEPMTPSNETREDCPQAMDNNDSNNSIGEEEKYDEANPQAAEQERKSLVEIYGSKKKRREEESEVVLRFNQKPSAGISYAAKCGHLDASDPIAVARYLLQSKELLEKTMIGEYLGREPEYQEGFSLKVLHAYVNMLDFEGLLFDDAIRFYLSGFRLPGEAQKIDRIMEKFAERYTDQNPTVFPTADVAFILAFSIIMLNTDLHNPAIKEERRMTKDGFIRNNRGICDGQDLPQELLTSIFDRIKANPISLKEDDEARERAGGPKGTDSSIVTSLPAALSPAVFFSSHYDEMEKTKESNYDKERDQIVRTTESLLKRRRQSVQENGKTPRKNRQNSNGLKSHHHVRYVRTIDSGLRDEYVSPMFEVAWGPALAAFSTAMESGNGTVGALLTIASDEELEIAAENAAETIEVCLTGFRFAVCTAGLCGNEIARDSFMLALARFSQLGTGILMEPRHVRCMQTMLALARSDGELLGSSWEHIFKSLSEINRFHQLFQLMARNNRVMAAATERRKAKMEERERRKKAREERKAAMEESDTLDDGSVGSLSESTDGDLSLGDELLFSEAEAFDLDEDMDKKKIDEANARTVYEAVSEDLIEAIYERSSSLSTEAVKEFVLQLCRVSRMEISHYGGQVGSNANQVDLTQVHYRQHHTLLQHSAIEIEGFHHHQPNIYNLQKLVEVTHYNMDSRPRLVFADLWTTVAAHLTSTALHSNPAVAMYAVDSFRQLSIQFLQRNELGAFEFQRRFLKPLETVMSRSELATTKELLLKCVERLILMFGSSNGNGKKGMLRSGWRPVLAVLGLAGRDSDEDIAKLGFELLSTELQPCLSPEKGENGGKKSQPGVLLDERFVDLVDALLIYVDGPHEDMGLKSIDNLLLLAKFLADDSYALPHIKQRKSSSFDRGASFDEESINDTDSDKELELWWPILLGISRSVGDERKNLRMKSLEALVTIINTYFFPTDGDSKGTKERQLQTLQLIFRGILTPVLEFGEADNEEARSPDIPSDFDRFLTAGKDSDKSSQSQRNKHYWLDSTFDQFLDVCIQLCLNSVEAFGDDVLVEEVFAMLNSCLLSDSGCLAVRGLRRLDQFITSDLNPDLVTDDTWATVCHMLRRCLAVRSLPKPLSSSSLSGTSGSPKSDATTEEQSNPALLEREAIREFVMEDNMLADRRYIGSNAVFVIGTFLTGERFIKSLGLRWRLFLVSGLGKAIRDWERAASIISEHGVKTRTRGPPPPNYLETAFYGRRWMNTFLLQVSSMKEVAETAAEGSRSAAAQALIKEQTQSLVTAFLEKEAVLSEEGKKSSLDTNLFNRLTTLVKDMLAGYAKLPDEHLASMSWLNPVLSSCIHTSNEQIRIAIQKLVKRLH